jgi:hypothetical protein
MSHDDEEMMRRQSALDQDDEDGNAGNFELKERLQMIALRKKLSGAHTRQRELDEELVKFETSLAPPSVEREAGPLFETGTEVPEFDPDLRLHGVSPGDRIALPGKRLFGVKEVYIGGRPATDVVIVSSERIECTVPLDITSNDIKVLHAVYPGPKKPHGGDFDLTVVSVSMGDDDYYKQTGDDAYYKQSSSD